MTTTTLTLTPAQQDVLDIWAHGDSINREPVMKGDDLILATETGDFAITPTGGINRVEDAAVIKRGLDLGLDIDPDNCEPEAVRAAVAEAEATVAPIPEWLAEGGRVRLTEPVERFPHFKVEAGAVGVITEATSDLVTVRMLDKIDGAEDWDNEVCWSPENCYPGPSTDARHAAADQLEPVAALSIHPFNDEWLWAENGTDPLILTTVGDCVDMARETRRDYELAVTDSTFAAGMWFAVWSKADDDDAKGDLVAMISPLDKAIEGDEARAILDRVDSSGEWPVG